MSEKGRTEQKQKKVAGNADDLSSGTCKDLRDISISPCQIRRWSRGESNPRPDTENPHKYADSETRAAPCAARDAAARPVASELAELIDAWADLPEPVRRGIMAMVEASKGGGI